MALAVVSCFPGLDDVRINHACKKFKRQDVVRGLEDLHRGQVLEHPIWPLGLDLDNSWQNFPEGQDLKVTWWPEGSGTAWLG